MRLRQADVHVVEVDVDAAEGPNRQLILQASIAQMKHLTVADVVAADADAVEDPNLQLRLQASIAQTKPLTVADVVAADVVVVQINFNLLIL